MIFFQEFHLRGKFEKSLNASFISLNPKKVGAVHIKDFGPISLAGSAYQIISEVLSNRLKTILEKVISRSQNVFINGKQISNLGLLDNECFNS